MPFSVDRIDHDANIGITVLADSPEELFRGATEGMLEILLDSSKIESRTIRIVSKASKKIDLLLVGFLNEILDLVLLDGFAARGINIGEFTDDFIVAEVSGQKNLPEYSVLHEIKAVTCHQLEIKKDEKETYSTRIIFDL
ncbi:archease [bacterium]|nr:archease [bacterium]